ncbi:DUF3592 domain-containing protein [Streptomyces coffeae]|uniref:DUF3592 domain-containing protein n=1 Tax=Streptomyces coffeae TaxID=621382 RepID=A0ABS1NGV7_9ACTN|nr:DUF3592 domain-containing protein [Streptomyces coffeae]MBL1099305.1 DUF3592 domain-containing protein [Streptomyces coffeae]
MFILVGGVFCLLMFLALRQVRSLLQRGVRTEGVVSRLESRQLSGHGSESTTTLRSRGTTVYAPVVAWTTADNQPRETKGNMARPLDKTVRPGTRVAVVYDPADPSHSTLPSEGMSLGHYWSAIGFGALFVVVGVAILSVKLFMMAF